MESFHNAEKAIFKQYWRKIPLIVPICFLCMELYSVNFWHYMMGKERSKVIFIVQTVSAERKREVFLYLLDCWFLLQIELHTVSLLSVWAWLYIFLTDKWENYGLILDFSLQWMHRSILRQAPVKAVDDAGLKVSQAEGCLYNGVWSSGTCPFYSSTATFSLNVAPSLTSGLHSTGV